MIGERAERFGLETQVLRHWEAEGLLSPARDSAARSRFGDPDAMRLDQIGTMLDGASVDRRRVLDAHLADIDERIVALERSRAMAQHAMECRAHDIATCPRFREHVSDIVAGTRRGFPALAPGYEG